MVMVTHEMVFVRNAAEKLVSIDGDLIAAEGAARQALFKNAPGVR
jgi:ABC-type polar amino acid transport system ATPase subunit